MEVKVPFFDLQLIRYFPDIAALIPGLRKIDLFSE